ncbi:MAG: hypothetical protein DDG59_00805 [Anaerolineae bacterium]|nr:MAG: hypothetical protein DDG59_00805 [Anaerolineae bacterium]
MIFNECIALLYLMLTPGNVDDRKLVCKFARNLFGTLSGDKSYLCES